MQRRSGHTSQARRMLATASLLNRRGGSRAAPTRKAGPGKTLPVRNAWRDIAEEELPSEASRHRPLTGARLSDWLLVLEARAYPYRYSPKEGGARIEVPAAVSGDALREIREFEAEADPAPVYVHPKRSLWPVLLALLALFAWHGLRNGWFVFTLPVPPFPPASGWPEAFGLDTYRTIHMGEWWRTVTALGVHKDDAHLAGNLCFGLLFICLFCQRAGNGLGLFAVLTAAALGNVGNAVFRATPSLSIGFSTAVFAAVGLIGAFSCLDFFFRSGKRTGGIFSFTRSVLLPLAAGVALLAFLGGASREGTDFAAHAWGFGAGAITGTLAYFVERKIATLAEALRPVVQAALGGSAVLAVVLCWLRAVHA